VAFFLPVRHVGAAAVRGVSDAVPGNRQLQVFIFVQAFRWPTLPATMWACAGHAKVAELVDALDLGSFPVPC